MLVPTRFEREKFELQAVLASDLFQRAPVQAQVLGYLCSRYFEGTADQLNEYAIAVEALGRPAHFDNKRDSIVRVEIHALRKRLRDYYAAEGVGHPVQIRIPQGHYVPTFAVGDQPRPAVTATLPVRPPETPAPVAPRNTNRLVWLAVLTVAVAAPAIFLAGRHLTSAKRSDPVIRADGPAALAGKREIRIMAGVGHGTYIDSVGHVWESDRFFNGGSPASGSSRPIAYTHDAVLYQNRREGAFSYDIPLTQGVYELRLHFAETVWGENNIAGGGETSRLFHIYINDKEIVHNFDVIGNAGVGAAAVLAFRDLSPTADGKLHIRLAPMTDLPFLNGLEITPGIAGRMRPVRFIAADRPYTDKAGRYWLPDRWSNGGQITLRRSPVSNTSAPELYQGERYGNFSYRIPVAPGRYRLTLFFAERWFGPGTPAGGGPGSRLFDVFCNGAALLQGFDIYRRAGGADRALAVSFRHLKPNGQGRLDLSFTPANNYALLNALEVTDEAGGENDIG